MNQRLLVLLLSGLVGGCATPRGVGTRPVNAVASPRHSIAQAVSSGVAYLVKSQNADGSWGTGTETRGFEVYSMVPGSHDAFRVATTALCVMALREAGEKAAHDKGLEYLIAAPEARRDDGTLLYNTWAHIFALQALVEESTARDDPRLLEAAKRYLVSLNRYATYMGGWAYYDFEAHTESASMGPTSFGTAAGLVSLYEARQVGIEIPQRLVDLSTHRLEEMRLPNGYFLYGTEYKYIPSLPANRGRGAVGRTQPANYALWVWKSKQATPERIREGLDHFFAEHAFLEMGRKVPLPHESWYQTSGYYYYFDHYYAARLLDALPKEDRSAYAAKLLDCVLPHQEPDGSWWDYAMWDYHKPYGTAFAVMTLLRCE